jgi:hypothetical protein
MRVLKKSRTLKMNIFIFKKITICSYTALQNPTPLIPLPSVSFQCKTFRLMLVRGKMLAGGGGRPRLQKNHPLPAD